MVKLNSIAVYILAVSHVLGALKKRVTPMEVSFVSGNFSVDQQEPIFVAHDGIIVFTVFVKLLFGGKSRVLSLLQCTICLDSSNPSPTYSFYGL